MIFTIGEASTCNRSAKNLAHAFYPDETVRIIDFTNEDCFDGINQSRLDKIVFFAHGGVATFDGYSAEKFAELFNHRYMKSSLKISKAEVKNIYLIGCDIGFINDETQTSVSQEIVNKLFDYGFHNAKIHCIAKPDNAIGDVLYVEVLNCSGVAGIAAYASALAHRQTGGMHDVQTGYLKAYFLSQYDADRLAELEKSGVKNSKEIVEIKHKKSFLLINHAHPEIELNKPHNTFYPNESALQRKNRILKETARQYPRSQAEAIALLVKQREYLAQKSAVNLKMMAMRLDFLIVQVQLANEKYWPQVVGEYARYLTQNPIYAGFFNSETNTYKLLYALSKTDFKSANTIVAAHENSKQDKKHSRLGSLFAWRKNKEHAAVRIEPFTQIPQEMTEKINHLAQELRREIMEIRLNCFSFFYIYEINTKRAKLEIMNSLLNCKTINDAKQIANDAIKKPRVMRSMKHTRTKDILMEVIACETAGQHFNLPRK